MKVKHFLDRQTDQDAGGTTQGDYTYLDNIEFFGKGGLASKDLSRLAVEIKPNPATEEFRIKAELKESDDVNISIIDVSGRVLISTKVSAANGILDESIDVRNLSQGLYTVLLEGSKYFGIQKVVVE